MKKKIFIVLIVVFAILSGLWYAFFYKEDNEGSENSSEIPATCAPSPLPTVTPKVNIFVHICGEVDSPGVLCLEKGSRLIKAVEDAGGFTVFADTEYLNLARVLTDGERIYVPSVMETELLTTEERMAGKGLSSGEDKKDDENEVVNINSADADKLTSLPGIGESKARDIIAYRTKVGEFEKKEDIKNVSGIGESLYARIADLITVE